MNAQLTETKDCESLRLVFAQTEASCTALNVYCTTLHCTCNTPHYVVHLIVHSTCTVFVLCSMCLYCTCSALYRDALSTWISSRLKAAQRPQRRKGRPQHCTHWVQWQCVFVTVSSNIRSSDCSHRLYTYIADQLFDISRTGNRVGYINVNTFFNAARPTTLSDARHGRSRQR